MGATVFLDTNPSKKDRFGLCNNVMSVRYFFRTLSGKPEQTRRPDLLSQLFLQPSHIVTPASRAVCKKQPMDIPWRQLCFVREVSLQRTRELPLKHRRRSDKKKGVSQRLTKISRDVILGLKLVCTAIESVVDRCLAD